MTVQRRQGDHLTPAQKRVAKLVGLTLGRTEARGLAVYRSLAVCLRHYLTTSERQGLAWAALTACEPDEAEGIACDVLGLDDGVGMPYPPLDEEFLAGEAALWAASASETERLLYALAVLRDLSPAERAALLEAAA